MVRNSANAFDEAPKGDDNRSADVKTLAERELAAFCNAVKKLFGSRQAELAANDWLRELEIINALPASIREWRMITISAARQLAARLNVPFQQIEPTTQCCD
jgi:hypothetical protein